MFNSFKYSGISYLLDGIEDDTFRGLKTLKKSREIVEIENEEESDQVD